MNASVLTPSSHLPQQGHKCGIYKIGDAENLGYTKQENIKKIRTKNLSRWEGMKLRLRQMTERLDLRREEGREGERGREREDILKGKDKNRDRR